MRLPMLFCLVGVFMRPVEAFVAPSNTALQPWQALKHDSSYYTPQRRGTLFQPAASSLQESLPQDSSISFRFKSLSIVYGILSATLFLMPDRTLTKKLATKVGGAAGFGVAAAVANLLAKSPKEVDLVTQKRLQVGLCGFSLLGLLAVPGEAGFLPTAGAAMVLSAAMNAAKVWGALVAFSSLGILSKPKLSVQKIQTGLVTAWKGLRVTKEAKKRSLTYRNLLLLVLTGMISCLLEGLFYVRYYGSTLSTTLFDISLQWSAVARLFLISSVIYSLKNLADREQMTNGTTFIQLNLMVGIWAGIVGLGQGCTMTGYSSHRMEMIALSVPFLIKGLKYTKFRSDEKRQGAFKRPPDLDELNEDQENAD